MKFWIFLGALFLAGCDNTTISDSPNFSLFETSAGVVYLLDQSTGELKVISSKQTVINSGEVFRDDEGHFFKYLGKSRRLTKLSRLSKSTVINKAVNRTPKAYRFWFPPLRSGAGYHQRYIS